jgi:hypothetical protein
MDTLLATPDTDVLVCDTHADLDCHDLITTFLAASRALDDDLPQFWD